MSALIEPLLRPPVGVSNALLRVAYSGGLDSSALLHALAHAWPGRVHAVHVHHGLQSTADDWATQCAQACARLDVPLQIVRVQVDRRAGGGLEAAARSARHAAFAQVMQPGEVLVAAHHLDDQAETFLLRALRAAGPDGLGAMRPWRAFAGGWLWRPWLDIPRSAIQAYAQAHALGWIEDPSNADTALDRNFLRHQVLPLLRQRWPHAARALACSATLSAQAADLLMGEDDTALAAVRTSDPQGLSVTALQALEPARRARVVRRWIHRCGLSPLPAQGITQLETSLLRAASDADAQFDWEGARLRRWRDLLQVGVPTVPLAHDWETRWSGQAPLPLPDGGQLELIGTAAFQTPLQVTARRGGERIQLPGRRHSHALKHVLQTLDMPPWQRRQLPLLRDARGAVLAAGDRAYAASFDAWLREHGARLHWTLPHCD